MSNDYGSFRPARFPSVLLALLLVGLGLALAGNVYQFKKGETLASELTRVQHSLQAQITRLSDATSGAFDVTQRRFEELQKLQDSTAAAVIDARSELRHGNSQVTNRLEQRNQELAKENQKLTAELAALKQDINSRFQKTTAGLQNTSTNLETANAKLQHISSQAEVNRADLNRVAGDLSVVSAKLAGATPNPAAATTQPPSRRLFPFDLLKTKVPTRVGEVQIAIRSTDPKNNRYTMDLYTGDKIARGRDGAVNQAVQFYLPGKTLPYELVVSEVRKDEVLGYISAPIVPSPRIERAAASLRGTSSMVSSR
jgi:hypothetical protein